MYLRVLVALIFFAAAAGFSPAPFPKSNRKPATDDLVLMQGTYKVLDYGRPNMNRGGFGLQRQQMKVRISGNQFAFLYHNGAEYVASTTYEMKLTPKAAPKLLDMTYSAGDYTVVMKGIYKIEGNKVTLAYVSTYTGRIRQLQEPERPTSFDNLPPAGLLMVLERE